MGISEPAFFFQRPTDVTDIAGADILLPCQVEGDPLPGVWWSRGGLLSLPDSSEVLPQQGLRIKSLQSSDAGNYTCHASNTEANISATAKVIVLETPVITIKPEEQYSLEILELCKM